MTSSCIYKSFTSKTKLHIIIFICIIYFYGVPSSVTSYISIWHSVWPFSRLYTCTLASNRTPDTTLNPTWNPPQVLHLTRHLRSQSWFNPWTPQQILHHTFNTALYHNIRGFALPLIKLHSFKTSFWAGPLLTWKDVQQYIRWVVHYSY